MFRYVFFRNKSFWTCRKLLEMRYTHVIPFLKVYIALTGHRPPRSRRFGFLTEPQVSILEKTVSSRKLG